MRDPSYYTTKATEYAADVVAGRVVACKSVFRACKRALSDHERFGEGKVSPYWFDVRAAARVCQFAESFPHVKGRFSGTIRLEAWQIFTLCEIFGWRVKATGARRYRMAYLEVGRKNAKSTLASIIGLYLLAADGEPGSVVVSAATTRDQARLLFEDAKQIARRVPGFRRAFHIQVRAGAITQEGTGSTFKPLSAEGKHQDGLNVHGALIDELHAHRTRIIFDVIESATGSRTQSLVCMITTAGFDQAGICYEVRGYVMRILDGAIEDETFFGIIYTLDDSDDWTDESNWIKANPNLGVSVFLDDLQRQARKAAAVPAALTNFLTKRLSVWVTADTQWLDVRMWRSAAAAIDLDAHRYERCYIGVDLATKSDLCAACLWFPPTSERAKYRVFFRMWIPQATLEREENFRLKEFADQKHIEVHPGKVVDFVRIAEQLDDLGRRFDVAEVGIDPWQLPPFLSILNQFSFEIPIVEERQIVATMSPAMKEVTALLLTDAIEHDGNAAVAWMVSNVVCHMDAKENYYPRKSNRANKIDAPVAMLLACDRHLRASGLPSGAYEHRPSFRSVQLFPPSSAPAAQPFDDPLAGL